jgi:hypothetical protein
MVGNRRLSLPPIVFEGLLYGFVDYDTGINIPHPMAVGKTEEEMDAEEISEGLDAYDDDTDNEDVIENEGVMPFRAVKQEHWILHGQKDMKNRLDNRFGVPLSAFHASNIAKEETLGEFRDPSGVTPEHLMDIEFLKPDSPVPERFEEFA